MKKKTIVEDIHGNQFEMEVEETRILTEAEVMEHIKNTPKIDVEFLLAQGYRKLEDVCRDIENGNM
jgi:hypothetical protein